MAKVSGPLLSQTASGKIAERLVFSLRSSGQQVRFQKKQIDVITNARISQREIYSSAVAHWKALPDIEKIEWIQAASELQMTGYNLYIKNYLDEHAGGLYLSIYGVAAFGRTFYGEI